jgi:cysteine-rich repeat protein
MVRLGSALAYAGPHLLVGAADSGAGIVDGLVYVFDVATGVLVQTLRNPPPSFEGFGAAVTGVGNSIVAGVYGGDLAYVFTICGDGTTDPGEQCDDGNTSGGDGCSATCESEGSPPTTTTTNGGSSSTTSTTQPPTAPLAVVRPRVQTVTLEPTRVYGGLSFDPLGESLEYEWTFDSRPSGSTATLQPADGAQASFLPDVPGAYRVQLVVHAGGRASAPVIATVSAVVASPLGLTISEPQNGSTLTSDRVRVRGSITGPPNTGVTVNGMVATVHGGFFTADDVPLRAGLNTILATTTTADDDTLSTSVGVMVDQATPPQLSIRAIASSPIAPIRVRFEFDLRSNSPATSVQVDLEGDGVIEFSTDDPSTLPEFTYTAPGLYSPRIIVGDEAGALREARTTVVAHAFADLDAILQTAWSSINTALLAGDLDAALVRVSRSSRPRLGAAWRNLLPHLPTIIPGYSGPLAYTIRDGVANYFVTRAGGGSTKLYFVAFLRDPADGVWRLDAM